MARQRCHRAQRIRLLLWSVWAGARGVDANGGWHGAGLARLFQARRSPGRVDWERTNRLGRSAQVG